MFILILALLVPSSYAGSKRADTCAMAETSLHATVGIRLLENGYRGRSLKGRASISRQRSVDMAKTVVAGDGKRAALIGVERNMFDHEPKFFTAYRSYHQSNPCMEMSNHLRTSIVATQASIREQCANAPGTKIIKLGRLKLDSAGFMERGLFLDHPCDDANINKGELYSMHQLSNGLNASVEQVCQAALSGLKEVWSKVTTCKANGGWYDLAEWSRGKIVKRPPPK